MFFNGRLQYLLLTDIRILRQTSQHLKMVVVQTRYTAICLEANQIVGVKAGVKTKIKPKKKRVSSHLTANPLIFMARLKEESSNQLFTVLEEWEKNLKGSSLDKTPSLDL